MFLNSLLALFIYDSKRQVNASQRSSEVPISPTILAMRAVPDCPFGLVCLVSVVEVLLFSISVTYEIMVVDNGDTFGRAGETIENYFCVYSVGLFLIG